MRISFIEKAFRGLGRAAGLSPKRLFLGILLCIVSGTICTMSLVNDDGITNILRAKPLLHVLVNFFCFCLLSVCFSAWLHAPWSRALLLFLAVALALGGEYLRYVQGHYPVSLSELQEDLAGIAMGAGLCFIWASLWVCSKRRISGA